MLASNTLKNNLCELTTHSQKPVLNTSVRNTNFRYVEFN